MHCAPEASAPCAACCPQQEAKSKQDPANGSGSDDGAIPTATPDPACRSTLTYQQYLQLAERLDEELAQVDDVMCDLAARWVSSELFRLWPPPLWRPH